MSYDSIETLSKKADQYKKDKKALDEEFEVFSTEYDKLQQVDTASLDKDVQTTIENVYADFLKEKEALNKRDDDLNDTRDALVKTIEEKHDELDVTRNKLEALSGKKYTEGFNKAREKVKEHIHQVEQILMDLQNGSTVTKSGNDGSFPDSMGIKTGGQSADYLTGADIDQIGDSAVNAHNSPTYQHSGFIREKASQTFLSIITPLEQHGVEFRAIQPFGRERKTEEIVSRLGGEDRTVGSCSSLAFAYAGNKAGYDVLDFRDGQSRDFFSKNSSIERIATLPGVNHVILRGTDEISCSIDLLGTMEKGKEYYLATGAHAAIVRRGQEHFEYLELQQHPTKNGWYRLDAYALINRFGCLDSNKYEYPSFLIDIDSLANSHEFLEILGFLNTAEVNQHKGENGYVR